MNWPGIAMDDVAMKKISGLCLAVLLPLCAPSLGLAEETDNQSLIENYVDTAFWTDSTELIQSQIYLLETVEQSLYSSEQNTVRGSYRRLFFHIGKLDRYLKKHGVASNFTCGNQPLVGVQRDVYCTLFNSRSTIFDLFAATDQRQARLGISEDSLIVPFGDPLLTAEVNPQEAWNSVDATFRLANVGANKPLYQEGDLNRPAIAPLPKTLSDIENLRSQLLALQPKFPEGYSIEDGSIFATTNTRYTYAPVQQEREFHQDFLAGPNTGISRLLPRDAYEERETLSSLRIPLEEQFPFPSLTEDARPNLPLIYEEETLKFIPQDLDLALISDLGAVSFAEARDLAIAHPIATYQSPNTLDGLQQKQRRLIFQTDMDSFGAATLMPEHAYLVRLIQYEFAPEILEEQTLPRHRLNLLPSLTSPESNDVLLIVKPMRQWLDGGYTLLWQVLEQSEATAINDLADYITVESPRRF